MSQTIVEYRVDADDHLEVIGSGWAEFALANEAPHLATIPSHRTLWSYIHGAELSQLWQMLLQRVRTEGQPLDVDFRCDGPDVRRWMTMRLESEPDGGVRFRSRIIRTQPRAEARVLHTGAERDPDTPLVTVCGWCNRCCDAGRWVPIEDYIRTHQLLERERQPGITHGICADCELRHFPY